MNRNHDFGALFHANIDDLIWFLMPRIMKWSLLGINLNVFSGVTFVNLANCGRSVVIHVVCE